MQDFLKVSLDCNPSHTYLRGSPIDYKGTDFCVDMRRSELCKILGLVVFLWGGI